MFKLQFDGKSNKQYQKLETKIRFQYTLFLKRLEVDPFIGKLSGNTYHAHVKYHWVLIWEVDKEKELVTIIYAGSRENAPY